MSDENVPQTPPTPMESARDAMVQNAKDEAKYRLQRKLYDLAYPYLPRSIRHKVKHHLSKMLFSLVFGCVFFAVFGVVVVGVVGVVALAALGFL
jgi:hypothetical protein